MRLFALLALAACSRPTLVDRDADGASSWTDCDDEDGDVHPGAAEQCNGEDDDCDGEVDEDAAEALDRWRDADGDGYGAEGDPLHICRNDAEGTVTAAGDCDDDDVDVHPGGAESCLTDADDDCDGQTNQADAFACATWYADADGDGAPGWETACFCEADADWLAGPPTDCDDADPARAGGCGLQGETVLDAPLSRIAGAPGDRSLGAVLLAGDFDGDDVTDLLIGSEGSGTHLALLRGPFLGDRDAAAAVLELSLPETYLPRLRSSADLTGDGGDDLVVAQRGDNASESRTWVIEWRDAAWGSVSDMDTWSYSAAGPALGTGDVTGDGVADLVTGEYGVAAYVWRGPVTDYEGPSVVASAPEGTWAYAVHAGTDLDGDGFGDLGLAARDSTATYALWLLAGPLEEDRDLADADAVVTHPASAETPEELISVGDCDDDGLPDLALSDGDRGVAWVLPGTLRGAVDATDTRIVLVQGLSGPAPLAPLGDLDGDDRADLAIGMPDATSLGVARDAGAVGIWHGAEPGDLDFADLLLLRDLTSGDQAGFALAAGDLDADGALDLAVGAPGMDLGGPDAGGAWLLSGAP